MVPAALDSQQSLSAMFDAVLQFVEVDLADLIAFCQPVLPVFHFMSNSVWSQIADRLLNDLHALFAPGIPDTFQTVGTELSPFMLDLLF